MVKYRVKKFSSFIEEQKNNLEYYSGLSPLQRLDIMGFLREAYRKISGKHENSQRLRRSVKIIQQA